MEEKNIKTEEAATAETAETVEAAEDTETTEPKEKKKSEKKSKAELLKAKEEIARLQTSLAEQKDQYLRLAAEYDNFRRRSAKEKDGIYAGAICDAVSEILPLLDNLERAGQFSEAEKVAEGLAMMAKMSDAMLEKLGVKRFGKKGETFNPDLHNAVMHIDDEAFGENEIVEVFAAGYARGDKVIRFAMVKVAN